MIHQTIIIEDTIIIATERDGMWYVTVCDTFKGKQEEFTWTNAEWVSVLALLMGVGEDKVEGFDTRILYERCEPLFKNSEVRPIP
jgi:hypothetical protein